MPLGSTVIVLSFSLLLLTVTGQSTSVSATPLDIPLQVGPFVDKVVYDVIEGGDQQVLALLNNEIDLIGDMVDPIHVPALQAADDIEIDNVLRNGYGYLSIKTDKYPLNITDFRRAFAFALDKQAISDDVWEGLSAPQDSCIPQINPWSVEGQLPYTYYETDIAKGNYLLDRAGFVDIDADGWREAPDGSDFDILIEIASSSVVGMGVGDFAEAALIALHVDAVAETDDFYDYLNRLYLHDDYDMVFLGSGFTNMDVDWLAYEFWSEYADEPYWNFPCWRNATYDSWRDQLLHATDYDEVYEAAIEMQKIWVYDCPMVICYENILLAAHRTDRFEGFVNDVSSGTPSWWTNYRAHLKDVQGLPLGGTLRISSPLDIDAFNFMVSYSAHRGELHENLYDSLMRQGPDGRDIPWLAESYVTETHADNPAVTEGHTRLTFEVVQNATWSDGSPLTAIDVAFTFNYYIAAPGNPYGAGLDEVFAAHALSTYTAVVEFWNESYWHLHTIGYMPIIPEHIFSVIGPEAWNTWNPQPSSEDFVTSGPFYMSDYQAGEFVEISRNPSYFHSILWDPTDTSPFVSHPSDITYVHGQAGNTIVWHTSDSNPALLVVYRNDTTYLRDAWDGGDIVVDIDGLDLGVHVFALWVIDRSYGHANDTVYVYILEYLPTTGVWPWGPLSFPSLMITLVSLAVIGAVFAVTAKSRTVS